MPYSWSTTVTALQQLFQSEGRAVTDQLAPYIESAEWLVADNCTASGYPNAKLEIIHRYLSAHFWVILRSRTAQTGIATGPREMFEFVKTDLGLNNTKYGQQAMRLDSEGNLAALENAQRKVMKPLNPATNAIGTGWLGTPWEDQWGGHP